MNEEFIASIHPKHIRIASITTALHGLSDKVTKEDLYNACVRLGTNEKPLDIRTVLRYMSGKENAVRKEEVGVDLYNYLKGCVEAKQAANTKHI